jgi:hypothetical protein
MIITRNKEKKLENLNSASAIIEIVAMVGSAILFFLGLNVAFKDVKRPYDGSEKGKAESKAALIKSMKLIGTAVFLYSTSRFSANLLLMVEEGYGILPTVVQSLWEGIRGTGFLLVVPYILQNWWKNTGQ